MTATAFGLRVAEPLLTAVFLLLDAVLGLVFYPYLWATGQPTPWQAAATALPVHDDDADPTAARSSAACSFHVAERASRRLSQDRGVIGAR